MLFREQGLMTASILTAIGMAVHILVEALLSSGVAAAQGKGGGNGKPENMKE